MKIPRSTLIPALLLVYLAIMSYLGLGGLRSGEMSLFSYIATIVITLGVICLLHFFIKRRDRMRDERLKDIENSKNK